MIKYILNGKTISVKPEHEQHFLKNNPGATKQTSWLKGEEGLIPDELEFWKKRKPEAPGKSQEASQPQTNQKKSTVSSSVAGSSESPKTFLLNEKIVHVKPEHLAHFKENNPTAKKYEKNTFEKAHDTFNSWWNETYVGAALLRGDIQAYDTGEAGDLMKKVGNGTMTVADVQEWVKANKWKAENYKESRRMLEFQKKYFENGSSWSAWWNAMTDDPVMLGELLIQSYSTMYNTFMDSEKARVETAAGATLGFGVGSKFKKLGRFYTAMTGGMGALAAEMESSLAFGEFIQEELHERGLEFNDENIYNLLNSEEGQTIRNRAVGRGAAIGFVEAMAGGGAMLATRKALQVGARTLPTTRTAGAFNKLVAGTVGVGVEALGGGIGEISGRYIAGQDMDPAEIGFEAVTGTASAPISVGYSMATHKKPIYEVNGSRVSYKQLENFVNTADPNDIAGANIYIKHDESGIDKRISSMQRKHFLGKQLDASILDEKDRIRLANLEEQRFQIKDRIDRTGAKSDQIILSSIDSQIEEITSKYQDINQDVLAESRKARVQIHQQRYANRLVKTTEFARKNAALIGKDYIEAESDIDAQAYHDMAVMEHNERIDAEIQKIQKSDLSVDEQNKAIEKLNNSRAQNTDVSGADGFIVGDVVIINKDVAGSSGAINVGAHEVLHGVVAKHMQRISIEERTALISGFLNALTKEQRTYLQNKINERNAIFGENIDINSDEEVLTMFSDGIAKGEITFNEGIFDKIKNFIQEILRKLGIIKEFANGRQVYNFLKDYQKTVDKGGLLSKRARRLAGGGVAAIKTEFSRSPLEDKAEVKQMSELIDRHVPKDITTNEEFLRPGTDGLSPFDKVMQEILVNDVLDGYVGRLVSADKSLGGVPTGGARRILIEDIKFELIKKIRSEYKPIVDGQYRSLFSYIYGAAAQRGMGGIAYKSLLNIKKKFAQRPDATAAPIDVSTPEGTMTRQIPDTEQESSIDTQDLSPKKQLEQLRESKKQEQSLEVEIEGKLVSKELNFKEEINNKIDSELREIKYDTNKPYEAVKEDMMAQKNPDTDVRTGVKPTGVLFDVFDIISKEVFGVDAKSTMARKQTLDKSENESARQVIADGAKKNKSIKKFLKDILPDTNFNPATKKSLGTWAGLVRALYDPVLNDNGKPIRYNNITARKLNLDKFTEAEVAEIFGLTPDYKLLPWKKGFKDGNIKGVVVGAAGLSINQSIRAIAKDPAAPISIGKPETMFSRTPGIISQADASIRALFELETKGIDKLLKSFGIADTFDLKTEEGINQFVEVIEKHVLPLMPRDFWFGKPDSKGNFGTVFTPSYYIVGTSKNPITKQKYKDLYNNVFVPKIKALRNKKGIKFGADIIGIDNYSISSYSSIFKNKATIEANTKNGKIEAWNKKVSTIHREMWARFNEAIRNDKSKDKVVARAIGNYMKMVGSGTGHWHKLGAQFVGHSINIKGGRVEYEHAMPATAAYLYLMEASLNKKDFNKSYNAIVDNYKLIALDKADDKKLVAAKLQRRMPVGWKVTDQWWQRYFNETVGAINGGISVNSIMMTDGKTIGQKFNIDKFGRTTKVKYKSTPQQIKNSNNIKKAIGKKSDFSRTVEDIGMSVFDFDDTLGFTKSGVRVVIPNLDGKPKPKRKVIFLAGGAGSGKGNVISKLGLSKMGFKIVNQDISLEWLKKNHGLPADMRNLTKEQRSTLGKLGHQARQIARKKMMKYQGEANGVVVDGTGGSVKQMQKLIDEFKAKGYDVSMLFVDTSLEVALQRNRARAERSLLDVMVRKNHEAVQNNKSNFKEMFGNRFMEVNTDKLTMKSTMPKKLVNDMNDFVISYEKRRIDAAEFAEQGDAILEQGGVFDFSEFNNVVDGTPGPLLNKARERIAKYGSKDVFVLTARPQVADQAIHEFLKSQGVNIPMKNITGLANSTGEAKANWVLEKFAQGYNNIYFADDAIQNVEAVKKVLDQLDVKSDVVQAKTKFSRTASENFNIILEESQGTSRSRSFSYQEAKKLGKNKGWWRIFVPPSAEDFKGLLYRFLGKGKQGEAHMRWFKIKLLDPFAKGIRAWNIYKQEMVNEYKQLKKSIPNVAKSLNKKAVGSFTVGDAIRVYLWDKSGYIIPGLDDATRQRLVNYVNADMSIRNFADVLGSISKVPEGYVKPSTNWGVGNISTDLNSIVNRVGRKEFLTEYLDNARAIFTPENMNKIRALYGDSFVDALENIMDRMEHGGNRRVSTDKNVNRMYNWINGSIGAIMFFNMRSAILQTISTVNFINWSDNNIFKASAAFANQPQFWADFAMLFNSPMLKQRRAGIQIDVSASELSRAFSESKGNPQGIINWLLEKGFTPTQIADSFAISFGGASFFRNRFKTYLNQGFSEAQAKEKAMLDFQETAESTQQSAREDLISQQQAGPLGRLILAFQNVTMQYTRLMKKALSDLYYGRGDFKTNVSKIVYYGVVQNIIFGALQSALAMIMWGDDEEEIEKKTNRVLNGALDSVLRGTGIYGAVISTVKNTIIQYNKQKKKDWNREDGRILLEIVNLSPPIGSKLRKIYNAIKTEQYNKGVSEELGLRIENPNILKWASIIEATTNIPTERLVKKANNLEEAITGDHAMWQRIMLSLGWNKWDLGVEDEELEAAKDRAKSKKKTKTKEEKDKKKKEEGLKQVRCSAIKSNGKRCGMKTWTDKKSWTCVHHSEFKDGMDRDGDGKKEYRCTGNTKSGRRCKNKTENKNKKCYAHQ